MSTTTQAWKRVCILDDIPILGARVVKISVGEIAIFRNSDNEVFALLDRCPHKGGPLSQGMVHGQTVTCPLHAWKIRLTDGRAQEPDSGCTTAFETEVRDGAIFLKC